VIQYKRDMLRIGDVQGDGSDEGEEIIAEKVLRTSSRGYLDFLVSLAPISGGQGTHSLEDPTRAFALFEVNHSIINISVNHHRYLRYCKHLMLF
jgi:hypothetical protein